MRISSSAVGIVALCVLGCGDSGTGGAGGSGAGDSGAGGSGAGGSGAGGSGGTTYDSLCDRLADECGASDGEVAECRGYAESGTDIAEAIGCEAELDDALSCADSADTADFCSKFLDNPDCKAEQEALDDCVDAAKG